MVTPEEGAMETQMDTEAGEIEAIAMETAEGTTRPTQITEGAIGEDPPEVAR
jgi:hypothetical protein